MTLTDGLQQTRYVQWYGPHKALGDDMPDSDIVAQQEMQYNAIGKVTQVSMTDEQPQPSQTITQVSTTVQYDDQGHLTKSIDPDRGTFTYTYDEDGRAITQVTTSGSNTRTIGVSYDLLGRAVCAQDAAPTTDGSGACSSGSHPLVQNTYDTSVLGTSGIDDFPLGQLTQTVATTYYPSPENTAVTTTQQYQYNQRGLPITSTLQFQLPTSWNVSTPLPTYTLTQAYDNDGRPTTAQTFAGSQNGSIFTNAYDSTTGQLTGLSNNATTIPNIVKATYNNHGLLGALNYLNGSTTLATSSYQYDANLRPTGSTSTLQQSGTTIFQSGRTYDAVGNALSATTIQAAVPGQSTSGGTQTQNFCYDELNRLVWAGNSGTPPGPGNGQCGNATPSNTLTGANYNTGYAFTHLGQLWIAPLNSQGLSQAYLYCDSGHPHQVTGLYPSGTTCGTRSGATASYSATYDLWGNMATRTYQGKTATLSYDLNNRLVRWECDTHEWYAYDGSGSRLLRRSTTTSGTNITVYAFGTEEHAYDGAGTHQSDTFYYTFGGHLIAKSDGTKTQFFLTDELNSVISSFDSNGTVLGNRAYGPYGNTLYNSGSTGTEKGYTGQYQDGTGLDYYNARYYDPVVGIFISPDSEQGNAQGANPYAYVKGNPESFTDPSGHRFVGVGDGGGVGGGTHPGNGGGGGTGGGSVGGVGGGTHPGNSGGGGTGGGSVGKPTSGVHPSGGSGGGKKGGGTKTSTTNKDYKTAMGAYGEFSKPKTDSGKAQNALMNTAWKYAVFAAAAEVLAITLGQLVAYITGLSAIADKGNPLVGAAGKALAFHISVVAWALVAIGIEAGLLAGYYYATASQLASEWGSERDNVVEFFDNVNNLVDIIADLSGLAEGALRQIPWEFKFGSAGPEIAASGFLIANAIVFRTWNHEAEKDVLHYQFGE
ncbi:hypothetical protein KSX_93770 [Ktedonospora formicarum]|uniref:Teneurin-like YD-shell domain-containing protein n=1 Tax=Ktedonospora formicarum TaxID=2778364 RepID=A0A8J3IG31_9CHLR|nr:hypothetical protein KSX_93770 [Ktedonospora formicarum]